MNTSIKINRKSLPDLLQRLGEALKKGEDMVIHQTIYESGLKSIYIKIGSEEKKLLETEGESSIKINSTDENMGFSDYEIELMERSKKCPETDEWTDEYWCHFTCPFRLSCNWV